MDVPVEQHGVGEPLPPRSDRLDIHVGELKQLFNAMDPAPFRDRDLDPKAEQFIVDWSREVRRNPRLALIVHLSRRAATAEDVTSLRQAVREYFALSASHTRAELRQLFREGRWSLLIGLLFLGVAIVLGDLLVDLAGRWNYGEILGHGLLIGGWVALWRPFEIFLYEWWPILGEARLYGRLSAMQVQVVNETPAAAIPLTANTGAHDVKVGSTR
jgi:hypothetical protein